MDNTYHITYQTRATDMKGLSDFLSACDELFKTKYIVMNPIRFSYPIEGKVRVDIEYKKRG